jgi:hypothetical protein
VVVEKARAPARGRAERRENIVIAVCALLVFWVDNEGGELLERCVYNVFGIGPVSRSHCERAGLNSNARLRRADRSATPLHSTQDTSQRPGLVITDKTYISDLELTTDRATYGHAAQDAAW